MSVHNANVLSTRPFVRVLCSQSTLQTVRRVNTQRPSDKFETIRVDDWLGPC